MYDYNAMATISAIMSHYERLILVVRDLKRKGRADMAQQIVEDFNAAFARLTAALDTEKVAAQGVDAANHQIAQLHAQLQDLGAQLVAEQNKNAELEKALTDATAAANERAPAA